MFSKGKKAKAGHGKLIENDKGNVLYRMVNRGYTFFMVVQSFTRRMLWMGSCAALMYLLPMGLEMLAE